MEKSVVEIANVFLGGQEEIKGGKDQRPRKTMTTAFSHLEGVTQFETFSGSGDIIRVGGLRSVFRSWR
jgi:hypothetical protein